MQNLGGEAVDANRDVYVHFTIVNHDEETVLDVGDYDDHYQVDEDDHDDVDLEETASQETVHSPWMRVNSLQVINDHQDHKDYGHDCCIK